MHSYFKLVGAVITGILAFLVLFLGGLYLKYGRGPSIEKQTVLLQPVHGPMLEYPVGGFTSGILASPEPTLHSILENLDKAALDDRIDGVLLDLGAAQVGFAKLEEIRAGIQKIRDRGKTVWAWSDDFGLRDLYLASACDSFFVHPVATVYLGGIYGEALFVTGALEKLGIEPDINRIARYKSAAEMITRKEMSKESKEMSAWLQEDIYGRVLRETAAGFGMEPPELAEAMTRTLASPEEVVEMGLASGVRFWDEMKTALPRPRGKDAPRLLEGFDYVRVDPSKVGRKGKKKIAVVHAQGLIGGPRSGRDPVFGVVMGHESVNRDLRRALDDDDVVGVVFRVDSRGGASLTSNRIGRMVEVVNRTKPVVVSMVDVAASGGYTISYRARSMIADSNTLTGSIGSITGKFNLRDLYGRLGVSKDGIGIGPRPDFYSDYRSWTPEEREIMVEDHWQAYRSWIADIGKHRGLTAAEVDSLARGRVWTGEQAVANGLIDGVGDLAFALEEVRKAAGLEPGEEVTRLHLPKPEGFLSNLLGMELSAIPGGMIDRWMSERMAALEWIQGTELQLLEVPVP